MNRLDERWFWMSVRKKLKIDFYPSSDAPFGNMFVFHRRNNYITSKFNNQYKTYI